MYLRDEFKKNQLHDNRECGFPELLLYSNYGEKGVMELYDGSLQAKWRYDPRPLDNECYEDREHLDEQIARSLNLGSSWCAESNMIRQETTGYMERQKEAPLLARLIDEERRLQFTTPGYYFESQFYLTLTYHPPSLREQRIDGWLTGLEGVTNDARERNLERFLEKISTFESGFRSQLALHRLGVAEESGIPYDETLTFLRGCIFGEKQRMAVPRIPLYLNERFADFLLTGKEPYFNGKHVRVVCVDAFPDGSWPGVFTALERLPFAYRYHQRQILFHPDVSKKKYIQYEKAWKRAERKFSSKMMSTNGAADPDATEMKEEAKQAQAAATRGEFHFGTFNSKVILMHENLLILDEQIKAVREKFHEVNYTTRLETNNVMDSWRGSWPGHAYSDCRVFPVHTKNFAHTMPKSTPYRGQEINTSPLLPPGTPALFRAVTNGQTPYDGQLHHKEAAHCLCVGPTRGGKSAALAFTAAQWMARFPDPQVFAFDKRGSLRILCEAMGGTYYLLKNPQLCPLGDLEDPEEQAWATWYIEYLCSLNRLKVTPHHRQAISKGIYALATWPDKSRSITSFCAAVRQEEIAQALEYYTVDSSSGGEIIDSDEDSLHLEEERFAVFEMEHILDKDPRILHAVLPYLFRLVRKRLHSAKQTLIPIDEAWMTKDPRFADVLRSWLTESAGRGGACFLSTQNLSDFISAANPLKDVVMNQCKNQLFIPNARASNDEQAPQYRNFDLNDAQILDISRGIEQREYFLKTPSGFSKIDFQLGAVALSFCGASSDAHQEQWARLYAQDPISAPMTWLRHRNLPEWAAEYGQLFEKRQEELYDACA